MGVHILVLEHATAAITVGGRMFEAVRLRDVGKASEAADAAVAAARSSWAERRMPSAAVLPDGRVVRWEGGLAHVSEVDLENHPVIGRVTPRSEASPLRRADGRSTVTLADAQAADIIDGAGQLAPWRRPRISAVTGCEITEVVSANPPSVGPVARSFMTFRLRMDDGSDAELASFWHIPPAQALQADVALPGLSMDQAFEWLLAPLRQRIAADARVLCSGGVLAFRCGGVPLAVPTAAHARQEWSIPAGPALAALGDASSDLPGDLFAERGSLRFAVLGAPDFRLELMAAESGRLRLICGPAGAEEVRDVFPAGNRRFLADMSMYLSACGELSVMADESSRLELPRYLEWSRAHGGK